VSVSGGTDVSVGGMGVSGSGVFVLGMGVVVGGGADVWVGTKVGCGVWVGTVCCVGDETIGCVCDVSRPRSELLAVGVPSSE